MTCDDFAPPTHVWPWPLGAGKSLKHLAMDECAIFRQLVRNGTGAVSDIVEQKSKEYAG